MDRGVIEVHAPDGQVWWVKRAWLPRYRSLRDRVGAWLEERPERWYLWPLRTFAGRRRYVDVVPSDLTTIDPTGLVPESGDSDAIATALGVPLPSGPPLDVGGGGSLGIGDDLPSASSGLVEVGGGGVDLPSSAASGLVDVGGGGFDGVSSAASGLADIGGGGFDAPATATSGLFDIGGGGGITPADLPSGGLPAPGAGGGGGLDLDLDGDGDGLPLIAVVALVSVAAVVAVAVFWFVLLPLLLLLADGAVLLLVVVFAGLVRLLFRRPWDVVAVRDLPDGSRRVRRWEVRGFRRAGHARDDVARALSTGTDADLAVARVVVREPRQDDPAGTARSVVEVDAVGAPPAPPETAHVLVQHRDRRHRRRGHRR